MNHPARNADPRSSHEAADHIIASGAQQAQQRLAAQAVASYPGLTSLELARKTKLCRFMLARRLPECAKAGTVVRGAIRRCSVSKRSACEWHAPGTVVQLALLAGAR